MVPFYTFYSMFGFQRVGDLVWQAADARARGFLMGATAGRTTLLGEGLQHQDGHSLVLASTIPAVQAYDPAFAYEVSAIIKHGLKRMFDGAPGPNGEVDPDVIYYITLYNENYEMPARPAHVSDADIVSGLYKWAEAPEGTRYRATVLFSGSAHTAARDAAQILADKYSVGCELWAATSYKTLREEALAVERRNRLHPSRTPEKTRVEQLLADSRGPVVAVSDFMKIVPEQIARFIPDRRVDVLGTDGMGRSDTRQALRAHFEVDAPNVVVAVLSALARDGQIEGALVESAIKEFGLDPESIDPFII